MPSNARNLANLLGAGESTISVEKLGNDVPPGTEDYSSVDSLGVGTTIGETAFVEGSNRLYIWNGSGWYNIALINTTPTWDSGGQPAGSYVLDVDSPQDATVITLAASDPEGLPISYNYITGGSMDSIATISQDSSVFTITPKTIAQAPDGGTGSITFRATDGINILPQVSSFTLNFISIIENSRYTTLLATATGTSDNNNITDSSTNNHTITVNGDVYAGTFSPYPDNKYSANMDGGDRYYLSSSPDWNLGSNWTIEGWFYPTAQPTETCRIFMFGSNGGSAAMGIGLNSDMTWGGGGAFPNGAMFNLPQGYLNQWQHVAWVRDGNSNTGTIYVNGVASAGSYSGPAVQAAGNVDLKIGFDTVSSVSYQYRGYIADLRITKSAVYTSNFTPATERLISSDVLTDTKLLTFNRAYLKDESASEHGIAINDGDPRLTAFSPFDKLEYSVTNNGGSVYFDGSTDYIEHQGTFTLPAGTNANWTIECWVNLDQVNLNQGILRVSSTPANGNNDDIYFSEQTGYINVACKAGGINAATSNYKMTANTWHHIAMVKNSGTIYLYNNGVYCGSLSDSNDYSGSYYVYGGLYYSSSYCFAGHLSDFRISNSAIYTSGTSNFTPPTAPLSTLSDTLFHIKGTDASIIDKSQTNNLKLGGNTTGSTTQAKFSNTKSMYFDGSGDYISIPADDSIFSKDYTIEFWMYPTQDTNLLMVFSKGVGLQIYHQSGNIGAALAWDNSTYSYNGNFGSITTNAWSHISLVRDSSANTYKFYINGTLGDTLSTGSNINAGAANWIIGGYQGASYNFEGYIQDLRVTEGLTRYTANFTPPTDSLEG